MENEYRYQTLKEFLESPFGTGKNLERDVKYNLRYETFKSRQKIRIEGYTSVTDDYYIHLVVPSESDENRLYDVVIRFFSPIKSSLTSLSKYYIQFFSNSPGFMYQYAVLYRLNGFLIEDLYNKMDPDFISKLPEKSNPNLKMSYDSTIYFACRFLSENNFQYLSKFGILLQKKKTPEKFFKDITSFKDMKVKMDSEKKNKEEEKKHSRTSTRNVKIPSKSTSSGSQPKGIHITIKKTGRSHIVPKKKPGKSTTHK